VSLCPLCYGSRQVANPAWAQFYASRGEERDQDVSRTLDFNELAFRKQHGPETLPCPECAQPQRSAGKPRRRRVAQRRRAA